VWPRLLIVARRRKRDEAPPLYWGLTPNQVVAFNLARARDLKGWTQEEAAEALAPYLGSRWSKASFSAAERSLDGERIRQFDADELVAFARAFELPVGWFFMPPRPWVAKEGGTIPVKLATADAGRFGKQLALLIDLVFGERQQQALLEHRMGQFFDDLGVAQSELLTESQRRVSGLAERRLAALVRSSFGDIQQWRQTLAAIGEKLGALEGLAETAVAADLAGEDTAAPGPETRDDD